MIGKKAITMKVLISLILVIAAFVIILAFWFIYGPSDRIDKDACYNSVVLRSSFNVGPVEVGKAAIPLKCKTEKICLTQSGEDCEEFGKPTKNYPITKIELDENEKTAKEEIKRVLANSLYDCNAMLGEGKLDFMPHDFDEDNYCLICARIAFDEDAKKNIGKLSYDELYASMSKELTPSGKSYFEYVNPGWTRWEGTEKTFELSSDINSEDWVIDFNTAGGYAIIAQTIQKGTWEKWAKMGGVVAGGTLTIIGIASAGFTGPVGVGLSILGIKLVAAGTVATSGVIYWTDSSNSKYKYAPPTIFPYNLNSLKGLSCESFETAP